MSILSILIHFVSKQTVFVQSEEHKTQQHNIKFLNNNNKVFVVRIFHILTLPRSAVTQILK